jgi:hypothetical protein
MDDFRYSSLVMDRGVWSTPTVFPWGKKSRYPLHRRMGELRNRFGLYGENLPPTGNRNPTPQYTRRYTDWTSHLNALGIKVDLGRWPGHQAIMDNCKSATMTAFGKSGGKRGQGIQNLDGLIVRVIVRVKLSLRLINEDVWGWRYSSIILNLGIGWKRGESFKFRSLHPWANNLLYPMDTRVGEMAW